MEKAEWHPRCAAEEKNHKVNYLALDLPLAMSRKNCRDGGNLFMRFAFRHCGKVRFFPRHLEIN